MSKEAEKYSQGDLVEVRFLDIKDYNNWTPLKDVLDEPVPECKLPCHYINEDDKVVRVAMMTSSDKDITYAIFPKGVILSVRKIEEAELFDFEDEKE